MDELARFFLNPQRGLHIRYEILRALCVEKLPAKEVATRFGGGPQGGWPHRIPRFENRFLDFELWAVS